MGISCAERLHMNSAIGIVSEHLATRIPIRFGQACRDESSDLAVRDRNKVQFQLVVRPCQQRLEPVGEAFLLGLREVLGEPRQVVAGVVEQIRASRGPSPGRAARISTLMLNESSGASLPRPVLAPASCRGGLPM